MLHSKMTKMDYVIEAVLIVIGAIVCICILYPILNILAISISADGPVLRHDVRLIPQGFTLKAYKDILKNESILRAFGNSIFITGVGVVCSLAATYLAAYPIACCEFPGKKIYNVFVLIPMWFQGGMVPSYLCVQKLGLINSYWALILDEFSSGHSERTVGIGEDGRSRGVSSHVAGSCTSGKGVVCDDRSVGNCGTLERVLWPVIIYH